MLKCDSVVLRWALLNCDVPHEAIGPLLIAVQLLDQMRSKQHIAVQHTMETDMQEEQETQGEQHTAEAQRGMERARGAGKESAGWSSCSDAPVRKTTWRMSATCTLLAPAVPTPLSACLVLLPAVRAEEKK